jgi:eukaryotic-like serine/threonine-protein kinase
MNTRTPEPPGREQRLDEILAGYLKAAAAGRAPHRAALLDEYPELAPELTAFFDDRERFDRLAAPLRLLANGTDGLPGIFPGQVDGYELEAEIARGGMGVVWKARQLGLNRTVALKMLRAGLLAGPTQMRRFRAEAEAVAALDHPRIVPVYEVGEHEGQPYLVMKYLEGGSLADRLDRFRNDQRGAAGLLAEVAEAVDYAHRHGVLHRDLKPANILLDAEGRAHVTDFGLAKRLSSGETPDGTTCLTQTGDLVGTPSYMAPEQARSDQRAITVATDVYGLGAILYELLTGRPPFRGAGILETLNQIRDQPPVPPRQLRHGVDRDLETVCLKALEKQPGQRYPTVRALADDLRRYLAGEPVQARAVGPLGRVWRWGWRRPALASLMLALAVALLGGLAAVTWQWQRADIHSRLAEENYARAETERERAEANLQQAEESFRQAHEAVNEFCVRLSDNQLNAVSGSQPLRRDLLEAALKYYEQFLASKRDDPRLRTEMAGINRRLGLINASIGRRTEALAALHRSRKLLEDRAPEVPDTPQRHGDLGRTYLSIALLQVSDGQLDAALASFAGAERDLKYAAESPAGDVKDSADYASVLLDKGLLCARLGRLDEARACYEQQIALLTRLAAGRGNRSEVVTNLAAGHLNLGNLSGSLGRRDEAIGSFEKARGLLESVSGGGAAKERSRHVLAMCLLALGSDQFVVGHPDEGLRTLEKSREILEKLAETNPDVLRYAQDLSSCLRQTGHVHRDSGRPGEALKCYDRARGIMERLVRQDPASGEYQNDLAKCLFDLAGLQGRTGKGSEALANFEASAAVRKKLVAGEPGNLAYHCDLGLTLSAVAGTRAAQGKVAEGLEAAREAVAENRIAFTGASRVASFRKYLASSLGRVCDLSLRSERATEAVAATRERRELCADDGPLLYACALDFARAADVMRKKGADGAAGVREYETLVLETLGLAVRAKFKDAAKMRADFGRAPFRGRPEFEKLLDECSK